VWSAVVHSAGLQDNDYGSAGEALRRLHAAGVPRMRKLWADSAYRGSVGLWCAIFGWELERVVRPDGAEGFTRLPRRWVVERTFAWLGRCRRLSKDYEYDVGSGETMIWLAMAHLMLRRLAPAPRAGRGEPCS
jgi:putative transposase